MTLFDEKYGSHPAFANYTYAVLPKGSNVLPICIIKTFSSVETQWAEPPRPTNRLWYISKDNLFKPNDFLIDSPHLISWHNKLISEKLMLSELCMSHLLKPEENKLQGRVYTKFLLFSSELMPYTGK